MATSTATSSRRRHEQPPQEPPILHGRVPPHDIDGEAALISAMLLDEDRAAEGLAVLRAEHFYSDSHRIIFDAMVHVAEAGETIDLPAVARRLREVELIKRVGGAEYLGQLTLETPATAPSTFDRHARQTRELWMLRRAIRHCQDFVAEGYARREDVDGFLDEFEQRMFDLTQDAAPSDPAFVQDVLASVFKKISATAGQGGKITGLSTGLVDFDKKTAGLHGGALTIIAGRPSMGKTACALNIAVNVAIGEVTEVQEEQWGPVEQVRVPGPGVAIFSLEMPKEELSTRMLCSEARVNGEKLRQGLVTPEDWAAMTNAAGLIGSLPIVIDDTPGITLMELRGKLRRMASDLKRRGFPLGLVVIDYLQLMSGSKSAKNREQEISEISRGLKTLAKELGVPVIALSQLNRGVETRGGKDKRPMMSDLRECLAFDEWICTPRGPVRIGDEPGEVAALTGRGIEAREARYVPKRYNSLYEVRTQYGRIRATARHLVLTGTGYKQVRDLVPGRDVICAPRSIPFAPKGTLPHGRLLGWLLGNGGLSGTPSLIYRKELHDDVVDAVSAHGVEVRPRRQQKSENVVDAYLSNGCDTGCLPNPLMSWIRSLGIEGCTSRNKFVPESYLGSSLQTHRDLLRGLWEADGCVTGGVAKYATVSELLAQQVSWLLLTVGVRSTVSVEEGGLWTVRCSVADSEQVGSFVSGRPSDATRFGALKKPCPDRLDPAPAIFVELAAEVCPRSVRRFQRRADGTYKAVSKSEMARVVDEVAGLESIAESPYMTAKGVGWGSIYSVTKLEGEHRVADLQVPGPNNFVAGGLVVHNSGAIEQDADVIVFIYRDEYYNRETTEERGIAELIIAKQRNGPTGTVRTRFISHCTKFENLQSGDWEEYEEL